MYGNSKNDGSNEYAGSIVNESCEGGVVGEGKVKSKATSASRLLYEMVLEGFPNAESEYKDLNCKCNFRGR